VSAPEPTLNADTETVQADVLCAGLVAPSPRQKRKTTPEAWAAKADEWFAHVAACPYCSQFYEPESAPVSAPVSEPN